MLETMRYPSVIAMFCARNLCIFSEHADGSYDIGDIDQVYKGNTWSTFLRPQIPDRFFPVMPEIGITLAPGFFIFRLVQVIIQQFIFFY